MKVLARWGGAPEDTQKPLKWVLVDFLGNVEANGTATYYLADRGSSANVSSGVSVVTDPEFVIIDTGAIVVRIRGSVHVS